MNLRIAGLATVFVVLAVIQGLRALRADQVTEGSDHVGVRE
jgi:hypothetical protein